MVICSVRGCKGNNRRKNYEGNLKFFTFPKNADLCKTWIRCCGKAGKVNTNTERICSIHFTDDDWLLKDILLNTPVKKRHLKKDAVPTQNLPNKVLEPSDRSKRYTKNKNKKLVQEILNSPEM